MNFTEFEKQNSLGPRRLKSVRLEWVEVGRKVKRETSIVGQRLERDKLALYTNLSRSKRLPTMLRASFLILQITAIPALLPFAFQIHIRIGGQIDNFDQFKTGQFTTPPRGVIVGVTGDPERIQIMATG